MQGVDLSISLEGCLRVRSRAVGLTYLPEPSANLGEGCYQSADLARLENGQVYLQGRQTDQVNVAGRKLSPESIERVLLWHPAVSECLVFGVPSPDLDRTEMIVACVVAKTGVTADELKQHLLRELPAWQVPRDWWFVPGLEVNQRGKLARSDWRQKYLQRQDQVRAPSE
jgi:acyl-coenzyme A synthetase/AMP-(fatty) acid ligase